MTDDLFLDTFVGDIPQPFSTDREEVLQGNLLPNQYQAAPVEQRTTTPKFYLLERSDSISPDPDTVEVTEDFILTHITVQCSGDPNAGACNSDVACYIGQEQFLSVNVVTASTVEHFNSIQEIPIPNWLITKGTLFGCYIASDPDASVRANLTFIGYKK